MGEFDQALVLASPHEKSERVRDAQWLMKGNSVFGSELACYKDGTVDWEYGLISAEAARRTKYWLGFPISKCDPTFGQTLYDLLVGHTKLSSAMKANRSKRLSEVTPGQKALALLRTYNGITENPRGTNRQMFGEWYSQIMRSSGWNGVPWCAETESYCFYHTGYRHFIYASVQMIFLDAQAYRNNLRIVRTFQEGDIMLYSIGNSKYAHTAFFDGWKNQAAGTFYDFGGNTGPHDISNGGAVMRQERNMSIVLAGVRVG